MSKSERKLHERRHLPESKADLHCLTLHAVAAFCTGLDAGVTSQLTSQICFAPGLSFPPGGWAFVVEWVGLEGKILKIASLRWQGGGPFFSPGSLKLGNSDCRDRSGELAHGVPLTVRLNAFHQQFNSDL